MQEVVSPAVGAARADLHTLTGNARVSDATAYWRLHEALDVMAAHSPDLHQVVAVAELLDDGVGQLVAVPADVAREEDVARTAEIAIGEFGATPEDANDVRYGALVCTDGESQEIQMAASDENLDVDEFGLECHETSALAGLSDVGS